MKNKTAYVQTALLAILLVAVWVLNSNIGLLRNDIRNLGMRMDALDADMSRVSNEVSGISEKDKLVDSYDFQVGELASGSETVDVSVKISFNRLPAGAKVFYAYKPVGAVDESLQLSMPYKEAEAAIREEKASIEKPEPEDGEWAQMELSESAGGYGGDLQLDYRQNYQCKVVVESETETLTETLGGLALYAKMKPDYRIEVTPVSEDGESWYDVSFFGYALVEDSIASVRLAVYSGGKQVDAFELMEEAYRISSPDGIDTVYHARRPIGLGEEEFRSFLEDLRISAEVVDRSGRVYNHEVLR